MIGTAVALAPDCHAQATPVTQVITIPDGLWFNVDGQDYQHSMAGLWPAGSPHQLLVSQTVQTNQIPTTRFVFQGWATAQGSVAGNPISIYASPYITQYQAIFDMQYMVSVRFQTCGQPGSCPGNGDVTVSNVGVVSSDQDIYIDSGSQVTLTAVAHPGYAFAGWQAGPYQLIQGAVDTITVAGPMTVYPQFVPARAITVASSPPNFQLLIDHAPISPPWTFQWGWDAVHTLDVISPQVDAWGRTWVFDSWSDGGASQHTYTVAEVAGPATLTATFVPAVGVCIATSPGDLNLTIDGRSTPPPYYYWWHAGDTHQLQAPLQQTDAQGHLWSFTGWSNGVTANTQNFVVPNTGLWLTASYVELGHLTIYSTIAIGSVMVNGAACAIPCDLQRPLGTKVDVSAPASIPLSNYTRADFSGWTGSAQNGAGDLVGPLNRDPRAVRRIPYGRAGGGDWVGALNGDPQAIWANFQTMNLLVALANPPGSASWTMLPASPDGYYDSQSSVNISVSANPGYRFLRWSGDLSGSAPSGTLAMNQPHSVTAILSPIPYVAPTGVINAAGVTPQPDLACGSMVSVYGASLASAVAIGPNSPLAQTLGGVTVSIGGRLAPLFFVSPGQINLQLPSGLDPGPYTLTISVQGLPAVSANFSVARNGPGLFTYPDGDQTPALVLHEDGTLVTPDSPALRGELLTLYATGLGPLNPPRPDGLAIPDTPAFNAVDPVTVLVGDATFPAEAAFGAPGRVAVDTVQFRLGDGAPSGTSAALRIQVNQRVSNTVPLPVQ
jgi:uncharacterized protein (TIGR03437 family)